MKKIVLVVVLAVLPTWVAIAQPSKQPRKKPPKSSSLSSPAGGNPCKKYGPGFFKVEGSDTCLKIGGGISVEGGGGARR
jgi:hypothetical protein